MHEEWQRGPRVISTAPRNGDSAGTPRTPAGKREASSANALTHLRKHPARKWLSTLRSERLQKEPRHPGQGTHHALSSILPPSGAASPLPRTASVSRLAGAASTTASALFRRCASLAFLSAYARATSAGGGRGSVVSSRYAASKCAARRCAGCERGPYDAVERDLLAGLHLAHAVGRPHESLGVRRQGLANTARLSQNREHRQQQQEHQQHENQRKERRETATAQAWAVRCARARAGVEVRTEMSASET